MPRLSRWAALVALGGVAWLVAGCGASGPSPDVSSCAFPYTFTLPGGRQLLSGDCFGYLFPRAPSVSVRRGETFSALIDVDTGGSGKPGYPVPRPSSPVVQILSQDHATVTYRAVAAGTAFLVAHETSYCVPVQPPPVTGISRARYLRQRAALDRALEHPKPHNCAAHAVRVIG
jgi:hypothetical protein